MLRGFKNIFYINRHSSYKVILTNSEINLRNVFYLRKKMNSKVIIPILIYILLVIIAITTIIFIFYYNPFTKEMTPKNTYNTIRSNIEKLQMKDQIEQTQLAKTDELSNEDNIKKVQPEKEIPLDKNKTVNEKIKTGIDEEVEKKYQIQGKKENIVKTDKTKYTKIPAKVSYSKGSGLPDQTFDSYGEYISQEEYNYRLTLIKNLAIKTVIIDKLTKGNGISQEFFKVAYINKMIPAKILEDIVESKEFRELIPEKYRKDEIKLKGLSKGEKVVFNNQYIKNLLILWSQGRLTPIQKAWKVKAEK